MIGKGLWRVALFPICVIAVASGLSPAAAVAGTGFTWHPGLEAQISFPDAATNPGAVVSPVSCPVVNDCTALGQYLDNTPALNPHAVVLHEGAGGWGAATGISGPSDPGGASVGDVPYDLSCAAAGECTAVGFYYDSGYGTHAFSVTEHQGTWGAVSGFPALAAGSSKAFATLVSCPSVGGCTAAGLFTGSLGYVFGWLLDQQNGGWSSMSLSAPAGGSGMFKMRGLSCASPGNCAVVGEYLVGTGVNAVITPFVADEHGGVWQFGASAATAAPLPADAMTNSTTHEAGYLDSVSCPSAGNCVAVGAYDDLHGHRSPLIDVETGGIWSAVNPSRPLPADAPIQPGPDPGATLTSVSCSSAGNCAVVGTYNDKTARQQGMVATDQAGTWSSFSKVGLPDNAATTTTPNVNVDSVSCGADGYCAATGRYTDVQSTQQAFVVGQVAGTWAQSTEVTLPSGSAANPQPYIGAISCPTAVFCGVVGQYNDSSGYGRGLLLSAAPATPTLSLAVPASGTAGSAIAASAITAQLAGGASPTGTATFTVFGPQPTPPSSCATGGTTVGTAAVSGNGPLASSSGFTPATAGTYWWHVAYGGDQTDNAAGSACDAAMAKTVVSASGGIAAGRLSVIAIRASGPTVSLTVKCTGPAGASCHATVALSVRRRIKHKHRKSTTRTKTLSATTVALAAGQSRTLKLTVGKRFFSEGQSLHATVSVTVSGRTAYTHRVTLRKQSPASRNGRDPTPAPVR